MVTNELLQSFNNQEKPTTPISPTNNTSTDKTLPQETDTEQNSNPDITLPDSSRKSKDWRYKTMEEKKIFLLRQSQERSTKIFCQKKRTN